MANLSFTGTSSWRCARDVLSNMLSCLVIYLTQPFAQGDWITLEQGQDGWAEEIGLFYTSLGEEGFFAERDLWPALFGISGIYRYRYLYLCLYLHLYDHFTYAMFIPICIYYIEHGYSIYLETECCVLPCRWGCFRDCFGVGCRYQTPSHKWQIYHPNAWSSWPYSKGHWDAWPRVCLPHILLATFLLSFSSLR